MKRALVLGISTAVLAVSAGCASMGAHVSPTAARVAISADLPPLPETWPKYPRFSQHSCWAWPFRGKIYRIAQVAPSYAPAPRVHPIAAGVVAHRLLTRFGDRRFVRAIRFWPAPPGRVRSRPPADALRAQIVVRGAKTADHPTPDERLKAGIAHYEGALVGGALRDDLCDAGGAPLVSWGTGSDSGFAESASALGQRFPNPSPGAFRKRVALVGRRFGFTVASLMLLRPRQIAPVLIVKTHRSRKAFVRDIGRIIELLDPVTSSHHRVAETFEGFFFAAEDAKGPFFFSDDISGRHDGEGNAWVANVCLYPRSVGFGPTGAGGQKCS